jgi:ribonuclease-3
MLDDSLRASAETAVGHVFKDVDLLEHALTHASTAESSLKNNERLEFLGDAVLGLVVCDLLFRRFPNLREGDMTKIKSHVVSREACAAFARRIGLDRMLILGKGMQGSRDLPASLAACALESVIGAIYLDGGYDAAARFILPFVTDIVDKTASSGHQQNFKSVLQQHAQQHLGASPIYRILDEQGPDHAKCFKIGVEIGGRRFEPCWGATKKRAEQDAALLALRELGLVSSSEGGEDVILTAMPK